VREPFDPIRASFLLIAGIIGVHCLVVLVGVGVCAVRILTTAPGAFECDPKGRLGELLEAALATALAFAGGMRKPPPDPPPPPPTPPTKPPS
jgi:hypothetical protein